MRRDQSKLRVRGAVRAMNRARASLSAGLSPDEIPAFRAEIRAVTRQIESICRQHGVTIEGLAAPTQRAYRYLRELEQSAVAKLEGRAARQIEPPGSKPADGTSEGQVDRPRSAEPPRLTGVVASAERLQARLSRMAAEALSSTSSDRRASDDQASIEDLSQRARAQCAAIAAAMQSQHAGPEDLPARSRRAWQWMRWLGQPGKLEAQLRTTERLLQLARRSGRRARNRARLDPLALRIGHGSSLFRARPGAGGLELYLSAGFVDAPDAVLLDLIQAATQARDRAALGRVKAWARGPEFEARLMAIERGPEPAGGAPGSARGVFHDLDASFARVNHDYFDEAMPRPRIEWGARPTRRRLASYDPIADAIRFSPSLDRAELPEWFIDFVMYHELLHKALGVERRGGRRRVHSPEFRRAERRFVRFAEARALLEQSGDWLD